MKPYILVLHNYIRFSLLKIFCCKGLRTKRVELFSRGMKFKLSFRSKVNIGQHCVSDGRGTIFTDTDAGLSIGDHVYFNEGLMISCKGCIQIGSGCRFGPNVKIFDNDHKFDAIHGVSSEHTTAPIRIGENCWLGANVVILKGTTIGRNCVIGAGCVVKGSIPDGSLVTQSRELTITPIQER